MRYLRSIEFKSPEYSNQNTGDFALVFPVPHVIPIQVNLVLIILYYYISGVSKSYPILSLIERLLYEYLDAVL